jgi:hypothetical protein
MEFSFLGATATDETDFDDPFIFHVAVVVVVVGLKGKAIESNKVHHIKSHGRGGNLFLFVAATPTDRTGGQLFLKKQLAPQESFVTLETPMIHAHTHRPRPLLSSLL